MHFSSNPVEIMWILQSLIYIYDAHMYAYLEWYIRIRMIGNSPIPELNGYLSSYSP